jgi:hypothetical protein
VRNQIRWEKKNGYHNQWRRSVQGEHQVYVRRSEEAPRGRDQEGQELQSQPRDRRSGQEASQDQDFPRSEEGPQGRLLHRARSQEQGRLQGRCRKEVRQNHYAFTATTRKKG